MQTTDRDNGKLYLDIEDGFYYLNAGYSDMRSWKGIYFEYLTTNIDGNPVTYNWCLATSQQLKHIEDEFNCKYPLYLFIKGIGTLQGYYQLKYE